MLNEQPYFNVEVEPLLSIARMQERGTMYRVARTKPIHIQVHLIFTTNEESISDEREAVFNNILKTAKKILERDILENLSHNPKAI